MCHPLSHLLTPPIQLEHCNSRVNTQKAIAHIVEKEKKFAFWASRADPRALAPSISARSKWSPAESTEPFRQTPPVVRKRSRAAKPYATEMLVAGRISCALRSCPRGCARCMGVSENESGKWARAARHALRSSLDLRVGDVRPTRESPSSTRLAFAA